LASECPVKRVELSASHSPPNTHFHPNHLPTAQPSARHLSRIFLFSTARVAFPLPHPMRLMLFQLPVVLSFQFPSADGNLSVARDNAAEVSASRHRPGHQLVLDSTGTHSLTFESVTKLPWDLSV